MNLLLNLKTNAAKGRIIPESWYFQGGSYFGMFLAIWWLKFKIMKKFLPLFLVTFSLLFTSYKPVYSIEEVVTAMRSGDANQLSKYFDDRIDIQLPTKSENYSRTQAEMILKDFFSSNSVKNFQVKHTGENNGAQFCIGLLQTRNGNYRTKLYMKQKGDRQVLQEIGFQVAD
jgi:hypothetical protein